MSSIRYTCEPIENRRLGALSPLPMYIHCHRLGNNQPKNQKSFIGLQSQNSVGKGCHARVKFIVTRNDDASSMPQEVFHAWQHQVRNTVASQRSPRSRETPRSFDPENPPRELLHVLRDCLPLHHTHLNAPPNPHRARARNIVTLSRVISVLPHDYVPR